ncbi:hypothetical protein BKA58DRAFT_448190 [Alternaria rosae]|uniref:uncharacterized protein n=1 Tax=Alternaria rosae TaxID=1187941 RepID=UPI001E8CF2E1|nr:uncharacterized protein BKA58DRAFT_448190 [Alternaria rosae]KAH6883407.1 hypothetical protein BKA58DRAFT_448190 [Alternaria rosae]
MQATEHFPPHMLPDSEWEELGHCVPGHYKVTTHSPPCTCMVCQSQYRLYEKQRFDEYAYTKAIDNHDAQSLLSKYVKHMKEDQKYMKDSLQCYGDALLNWWRTRRPNGRKAFLEQVSPELPKSKEAQVDYQCKRFKLADAGFMSTQHLLETKRADRKRNRQAFLLPYLNVPTLAKDSFTLLGLLQARTSSPFEDWAVFDNDQLTLNWNCGFLDVNFNRGCVILYGPDYGKLKRWNADLAHRRDAMGFPRAELLLEAQATLLRILRHIMTKALERMSSSATIPQGTDLLTHSLSSGRTSSQTDAAWSSYVHQPSSAPPRLDFAALTSEVRTRLDDIHDHLWLLQTEPIYLRRYLRLIGQASSIDAHRNTDWGAEILLAEVKAIVDTYWFWQGVADELDIITSIYNRFRDQIAPGSPLPVNYEKALGSLEAMLAQGIDLRALQLSALKHERPAFSDLYEYIYDPAHRSTLSSLKKTPDMPRKEDEYKTHRLWWCLGNMLGDYDMPTRVPYPMLLGMLDDHLQSSDAKERKKMDEIMYERFSDYATMLKLFESLRFHRPSYAKRDAEDCKLTEDRLGWRRIRLADPILGPVSRLLGSLRTLQRTQPPAGGKTRKWLEAFNADHAAAQNFWLTFSTSFEKWHERCKFSVEDTRASVKVLGFWKSEDYEKLLQAKRKAVLSDIEKRTNRVGDSAFLPLPLSAPNTMEVDAHKVKDKIKTHGEVKADTPAPPRPEDVASSSKLIPVPKRALSIFRSMFPDTLQERSAEIAWHAFVLSMTDAGFSSHNAGGSIVIFEENAGPGKIIFHRPHPSSKVDPIMFQGMGRRMNKHFGWNRETFAMAAKVGKAGG